MRKLCRCLLLTASLLSGVMRKRVRDGPLLFNRMAKRSAAVQISDRNPYAEAESDSDDDAQHSASSYSSRSAQESDVQGRRYAAVSGSMRFSLAFTVEFLGLAAWPNARGPPAQHFRQPATRLPYLPACPQILSLQHPWRLLLSAATPISTCEA